MSAMTPDVAQHAKLPPLASRFVSVASLPWKASPYPGIESRTLLADRSSGLLTSILRMAPGARLPDHEHVEIEQTYVLEGSLVCGEGVCQAGDFVWRPAGSRHEAWAGPAGALLLGMFQMPNRFFATDGSQRDFAGNNWQDAWGAVQERRQQASF